jgi:hypothetical protein
MMRAEVPLEAATTQVSRRALLLACLGSALGGMLLLVGLWSLSHPPRPRCNCRWERKVEAPAPAPCPHLGELRAAHPGAGCPYLRSVGR